MKSKFEARSIFILLLCSLVLTVGRGVSLPFLPVYLHSELKYSIATTGLILSGGMALGVSLTPFAAIVLDRFRGRTIVFAALFLFGAGFVGLYFKGGYAFSIVCLAATAFSYSLFSIYVRYRISELDSKQRLEIFSINYTLINVGWIIGPVLGVELAFKASVQFSLSALTSVVGVVLLFFVSPGQDRFRSGKEVPLARVMFSDGNLMIMVLGSLLCSFIFGRFSSCISQILMVDHTESTVRSIISVIVPINAFIVIIVQYFSGKYLVERYERGSVILGSVSLVSGIAIFSFSGKSLLLWGVGISIFTVGEVIFAPIQYLAINRISPPHLRATYYSAQELGALGGAFNPMVVGFLLGVAGARWVYFFMASCALLVFFIFLYGISLHPVESESN
ncbi:MFS transporter [Burkholderia cenocepacia]